MRHFSRMLFLAFGVGLISAATVPFSTKPTYAAPCLGPSSNPNGNGLDVYDCPSPSGPARASDTYAAVAISATSLDTGIAWGAASEAQAEQLAVQYCAKQDNNTDCKFLVWARDSCVAIAVSNGTGHNDGTWYASGGANRAKASAQAVASCDKMKNKDCTIRQSACSNDP